MTDVMGGLNPRPLNAPPAGQPAIGVQPGTSTGIIIGRLALIFGPTGSISGLFVYATGTTPGPGNPPIASMTNGTSDPFGNTVQPIIAAYGANGQIIALNVSGGAVNLFLIAGGVTESRSSRILTTVFNRGLATEQIATFIEGPQESGSLDTVTVELFSSSNSLPNATGTLEYTDTSAVAHPLLSWGGLGVGRQSVAGLNGGIPLNDMDLFTRTANTTSVTALTTSYSIPANDASVPGSQQTTYHLRTWGTGNAGNPADNAAFSITMFGTNVYTSTSQPWAQATHNFTWILDADVMISGNSATASFIVGGFCIFTDSVAGTNVIVAIEGGATVNNTSAGTMLLNWQWAAVTGGATISAVGSIFTRKGV